MSQVSKEKDTIYKEKENMAQIAKQFKKTKYALYDDLSQEFAEELNAWNAVIDRDTLSFKFKEPDVFFQKGREDLTDQFKTILDKFFPRYIKILSKEKYKNEIEEIRIEGHTSSEWNDHSSELESYFNNMKLSQARTRSVLEYVMTLKDLEKNRDFLIKKVTANGLSYSQRIMNNDEEDYKKSRRVEFKIRTTAEKHIEKILEEANSYEINQF